MRTLVVVTILYTAISRKVVGKSARTIPKGIVGGFEFRNSVLIISHITFRDGRVHIFFDNLSRNSCMLYTVAFCSAPSRYCPGKDILRGFTVPLVV